METSTKSDSNVPKSCKGRTSALQVDVPITELILTPLTCAVLVNEVLKCLLYEKSQIPYPYSWLRNVVSRRLKWEDTESAKKPASFTMEKHYLIASNAYNCVEDFMSNIRQEFEKTESAVREVSIIFGTTPLTPKQVFTIRIPKLSKGHVESNHSQMTLKNQHKVLRNICLSPAWLSAMETTVPSTNTFIVIKKSSSSSLGDFFVPCKEYFVPTKTRNLIVNLVYEETLQSCCGNLQVFKDGDAEVFVDKMDEEKGTAEDLDYRCYQAKSVLKGFRDCFVNKRSVSELW